MPRIGPRTRMCPGCKRTWMTFELVCCHECSRDPKKLELALLKLNRGRLAERRRRQRRAVMQQCAELSQPMTRADFRKEGIRSALEMHRLRKKPRPVIPLEAERVIDGWQRGD